MKTCSRKKHHKIRRFFFTLSCAYLLLLAVAALAAPLIAPYSPTRQFLDKRLLEPCSEGHLLGSDELGRDVLSRLIYGSRSLLAVGSISVSIALAAGLLLGIMAGLRGKLLGGCLMLLIDGILSFPTVLLVITVISLFGYGLAQMILTIGIVFTPVFARIVRAETKSLMTEGFVESSRALGTRRLKIVTRHIVPNMLPDLIIQATILFASAIIIEASLSFLGLGVQPPSPSWGLMLKDARSYIFQAPHLAFIPGIALAATVFSLNFIGDVVAEKLNPKL
ncbi:MAG: ABC transporter permease [Spirochaetales bacterium]|nr:ABC transporter permease [Spirochaetales bacterium]